MENKLQTLYRFFDSEDNLLYVGVSVNFLARINQHYSRAEFWDQVKYATFEKYETRVEVEAAEIRAIVNENPVYNKMYNPNYENSQMHFAKIKDWVYGKKQADETHAQLVRFIQEEYLTDKFWTKPTSSPIAYWFMAVYPWSDANKLIDCEFCDKLSRKEFYQTLSEYHERKLINAAH